jgi:alkyl hydroperoxide reductase subunit AhpC
MSNKALRIGDEAPDFDEDTTNGPINFHRFIGDQWVLLFAQPNQNPVSTTELTVYQTLVPEFDARGVKLIVLAPNTIEAHNEWIKEIQGITPKDIIIPFIADPMKKIARKFDMVEQNVVNTGRVPQSIRDIFIIDNNKKVRLIFSYPPTVGSSTEEILRVIDALKTSDKLGVLTGVNWYPGANVIVDPAKQSLEAAQENFNGEVAEVADFIIAPVSVEESAAPNEPVEI